MKKLIITQAIIILGLNVLSAQLKVLNNGKVGINNSNPQSILTVGANSDSVKTVSINGKYVGLLSVVTNAVPYSLGTWGLALEGINTSKSMRGDIGIVGQVRNLTPLSSGRAIGVTGRAGNATSGYNWGVIGALTGSNNGTGILGIADGNTYLGIYIPGYYAGYFAGNVRVTGTINGVVISQSDARFKQNITELGGDQIKAQSGSSVSEASVLNNVLELKPVQYNYKQVYLETNNLNSSVDTVSVKPGYFDENSETFKRKHYGLIAQELKELYPDLVYEDDNGYLSVDYTGLIPLLIQSVKELNVKIEELKAAGISVPLKTNIAPSETETFASEKITSGNQASSLQQNIPNPFNQNTAIKYYLPKTVSTAQLCIYDLNGKQLKQITLTGRGEGSQTISGSEFSAGIYLYALIADGQEVDVKRMILTE